MKILKLGAFELSPLAGLDITQRYLPIGGEAIERAVSGRGIKQSSWQKTRIVTSGSGWQPAALQDIDYNVQHTLACIVPRMVKANPATRQATLPAGRRSDAGHVPYGIAAYSNGQSVRTAVNIVGNLTTCDAVAGAVAYEVGYYPQFTVWALRPAESGEQSAGSAFGWELTCEEV